MIHGHRSFNREIMFIVSSWNILLEYENTKFGLMWVTIVIMSVCDFQNKKKINILYIYINEEM